MIIPCIDLMDGKVVQLVQGRDAAVGVAQHDAFGDLQHEPPRFESAVIQRGRNSFHEPWLPQFDR